MAQHEEWYVGVLKRFNQEEYEKTGKRPVYYNARMWYPGVNSLQDRYCKTEEEAHRVLNHAYKKWNGMKLYNEKGERYETSEAAPGIGVSLVCTKETDRDHEIVGHVIRKRIVSDWETVEKE